MNTFSVLSPCMWRTYSSQRRMEGARGSRCRWWRQRWTLWELGRFGRWRRRKEAGW